MRKFDFTQPGGFPLTQDALAFMQTSYTELIAALSSIGGAGPYVLNGLMPVSGTWRYSPGWLVYNGELYYFEGIDTSTLPTPGIGYELGIVVDETDTALTFGDGSTPAVQIVRQMKLGFVVNSAPVTATGFPYAWLPLPTMVKEAAFTTLALATFGASGTMYYRKNILNNILQIRGTLAVTVGSVNATGSLTGPTYYALAQLPAGYVPASSAPFAMYYRYHNAPVLDDTGLDHITQINAEVDASGYINAGLIKAAANYTLYFNTIIPLD